MSTCRVALANLPFPASPAASLALALDAVREMGGSTRGRKRDVDALAATVLLQQYLDHRRTGA